VTANRCWYKPPVVTLAALVLSACASFPSDEGKFVTNNDQYTSISKDAVLRLRHAWTKESLTIVSTSRLPAKDQAWSLDFIAHTESVSSRPCRDLALQGIAQLEAKAFQVRDVRNKQTQFNPKSLLGILEDHGLRIAARMEIA
jgi:hypothetical protein